MTSTTTPRPIPRNAARMIVRTENGRGEQFWTLRVQGESGSRASARRDAYYPPATLTEGLRFEAQYHSHEAEVEDEPDAWLYVPVGARRDLTWVALALLAVCVATAVRWPVAIVAAVILFVYICYSESRKDRSS